MLFNRVKPKPESAEALLKIEPARRYTRNEVLSLLALMAGIVVDGLVIQEFSEIKETGHWYSVDVDYGDCEETWYFFKTVD